MTIDLSQRRAERDMDGPQRCRECGSEWFSLQGSPSIPAQVTFSRDGRITGYHGHPVCAECGATS